MLGWGNEVSMFLSPCLALVVEVAVFGMMSCISAAIS